MKHHEHKQDLFWLNDMRFLAAIAIIVVHISQPYFNQESTEYPPSWWIANLYLSASMWGVPVFVMISGALLLSPEREYPSLSDFYKRRLNRLFLPIFFWTLVYLVLLYLKKPLFRSADNRRLFYDLHCQRTPILPYVVSLYGLGALSLYTVS